MICVHSMKQVAEMEARKRDCARLAEGMERDIEECVSYLWRMHAALTVLGCEYACQGSSRAWMRMANASWRG